MKNLLVLILCVLAVACKNPSEQSTEKSAVATELASTINESFATQDTIEVIASGLTMDKIAFDKKEIKVAANTKITIALRNSSTDTTMPHNMVIIRLGTANAVGQNGVKFKENSYVNPGDSNVIAHSPLAEAEKTIYFSFLTPPAGEYEFICSFPGHWGLMKGKFIAE